MVTAMALYALGANAVSAQAIDAVVLIVNEQAITASEFNTLRRIQNLSSGSQDQSPDLNDATTQSIINDALLVSHIKQVAPTRQVSEAQINQAIQSLAEQNQLSQEAFVSNLVREGIDQDIFRESVENRILIQSVISQPMASRIKVSEAEVREFIASHPKLQASAKGEDEYELYHLVVTLPEGASNEQRIEAGRFAEEVRQRIASGEFTFARAIAASQAIRSNTADGYLSWKKTSELPALFVEALVKLEAGELSPVLDSPNGLHLVRLAAKRSVSGEQAANVTEYQVRHILKRLDSEAPADAAIKVLNDIREQLMAGADFADVAKAQSDDRGSAEQGGALGWVTPEALVPAFANAMTQLPVGIISGPVRSRFGLHLIEVLSTRDKAVSASPLEQQARQQIFSEKLDEELQYFVNELKSVAVIEVLDQG